jgi:hypothetical protein
MTWGLACRLIVQNGNRWINITAALDLAELKQANLNQFKIRSISSAEYV